MPKDHSPIRIGLVGCGRGTQVHHLPVLSRLPQFHVTALADTDGSRLRETAGRFSVEHSFTDYRLLLDRLDIDAVAVVTPPESHAEIGLAALRSGKHLFMEKPLALHLEECHRLIVEAARSKRAALVALNSRWHRLVRRAREVVRSGALGPLKAVRSVYTHCHPGETAQAWHRRRDLGGGVLLNDGVHHFDLWRYLLGSEVVTVKADSASSKHFDDDTCTVTAGLANGALACALFSFSTSPNSELEIFGEAGRLLISLYRFDGLEFYPASAYPGSVFTRLSGFGRTLKELAASRGGSDFDATYTAMWRHFADCVRGAAVPECTFEDGKKSLQIALAAAESASSGRTVVLAGC